MWGWRSSRTFVLGAAGGVFVLFCILPVAYLFATPQIGTHAAAAAVGLDTRQRTLLYNTTLVGVGAAALSTAIGAPLGLLLARVPLARRAAIRLVLAAPMFLPPYVVALAWTHLATGAVLGALLPGEVAVAVTYSMPAAIVVLSLVFYPLCMLATEVGLRRIDGRLEEAALVVARPGRVLRRITLPLAARSVVAAALIVFVLAVSEFGVPALLRVRVYTTEVFTAFAALYDPARAALLAVPLLALCAGVGAIAASVLGDRMLSSSRLTGSHPPLFDRWRGKAYVAIAVVVLVAVAVPLVVLGLEASNIRSMRASLAGSGEAIANSLILSTVGATLVTGVALWLGYARARMRGRAAMLADVLCVVIFAVPSTIVGVGLIALWNRPGLPGTFYGTAAMFVLAYLARFLPVAALVLAAAVRFVPISHEEAAAAAGAGWFHTMRRVVVPQLRLGMAAAWTVVFVLSFGELGASVLIAPPGESTLPIRIYTIIANSPPAQVALLALLQASVVLVPLAILGTVASIRPATRIQGVSSAVEQRGRR